MSTLKIALASIAIVVLVLFVHTMEYRLLVTANTRYVERPYPGCRMPDPQTEYRVLIERRDDVGRLSQECVVIPLNPDESPAQTMQRLLKRDRTKT